MAPAPKEVAQLRKQVSTLAEFGKRALRSDDIDALLHEATHLVSDAIDVNLVKVLQPLPDGENLLVRAGVNWNPGVVGHATIPADAGSPAGYALKTDAPVITEDIATERHFRIPTLLIEHGVQSTVNVVIRGDDGPFGVLEVDSRQPRKFSQDDIDFLQNYANLLAAAIQRVNTQRELAEGALKHRVLGYELQHRINNILATIRAVARRTRARSENLDVFAAAFDQRLAAIARTHRLLSRTDSADVELREVLMQELSAHGAVEGENLALAGPEIRLAPRQAQVLGMAFHELATNAVKHGALSARGGRIDVAWEIALNDEQARIRWREAGVTIGRAPDRRGYGSEILEKAIPQMLHGSFERRFDPDGLQCLISFALDQGRDDGRRDRT
jgi:two-component sensor histidine kinase